MSPGWPDCGLFRGPKGELLVTPAHPPPIGHVIEKAWHVAGAGPVWASISTLEDAQSAANPITRCRMLNKLASPDKLETGRHNKPRNRTAART
jgi:hypothetical protein